MRLHDFLRTYDGFDCISIKGFCDEWDKESIMGAPWYADIKGKAVKRWLRIGGGVYKEEIYIELKE